MTPEDRKRIEAEADKRARQWLEVQYTAAKTEYIAGAIAEHEHMRKIIDAATDAAYEKGYHDATKEACDEIAKNYHPNV